MNYTKHFDDFWARYGSDDHMDVSAKGSKRKAFEAWEKACKKWAKEEKVDSEPELKFAQAVNHGYGIHAQNRRTARRVPNKFVAPLPHVSTYLNQFRFEAEVHEGSGELKRQSSAEQCKCGGEYYGRDKYGKAICKPCHTAEWYEEVKTSQNPVIQRWRPLNMLERYPRGDEESWPAWSARVAKQIVRDAPASSPLKYTAQAEREDDWAYFQKPRRWGH